MAHGQVSRVVELDEDIAATSSLHLKGALGNRIGVCVCVCV